jgi:hypothetical protein
MLAPVRGVVAAVRLCSRVSVVVLAVRLWFAVRRVIGWRQADRRQRLTVALSALVALSTVAGVTLAAIGIGLHGLGAVPAQTATANRARAAAWIAEQVSPGVMISCDPAMCGLVQKSGFPAARLKALPPAARGPLGPSVIVATPTIRKQFGARLASTYAPLVIAGFGTGAERVDVRVVAPDGAAALRSRLAAEHTGLVYAGTQLLSNRDIQFSPAARAALLTGQGDSRLLAMLSVLASEMPIRLVSFGDLSPGASSAVPLREAEVGAASPGGLLAILAFLHAQQAPYRPAVAAIIHSTGGQSLVTVRFDAAGLMGAGDPG